MAINQNVALMMVKTRLNRLQNDTSLDEYLLGRIDAAEQEINGMVPFPLTDSTADLMLVVDYAVYAYQNRDKAERMPEWLRYRLRCRFLQGGDSA
jgi:hypothetical protein